MSFLPFNGAFSFGSQQRFAENENQTPGPGQYTNVIRIIPKKSQSFTKQEKFFKKVQEIPPVGKYQLSYNQVYKKVEGRTILNRPKSKKKIISSVGPGSYNISSTKPFSVTHTFGYKFDRPLTECDQTLQNNQSNKEQMESKEKTENQESKEKQMSKSRSQENINAKGGKPSFSKQVRQLSVSQTQKNPGPGYYNTDQSAIQCKTSISFGKSYRPKLVDKGREQFPGPGQYTKEEKKVNSEHVSKPQCYFGSRQSNMENSKNNYPSPCEYFPQIPFQTKKQSFNRSIRKGIIEENKFPGPAHYDPQISRITKQYSIGNCARDFSQKSNLDVPGPGQYEYKSKAVEGQQSSMRFRKSDSNSQQVVPGPGMYNLLPPAASQVPFIAVSEHLNNQDVQFKSSLGPGQYQLHQPHKGYTYTIGRKFKPSKILISGSDFVVPQITGYIPKYLMKEKQSSSKFQEKQIDTNI